MSVKTIPAKKNVSQLLENKDYITSEDIPLNNDFDYVMSIIIAVEYDHRNSNYRLRLLDGNVCKNGYSIPNMRIEKKS